MTLPPSEDQARAHREHERKIEKAGQRYEGEGKRKPKFGDGIL